MAVVCVFGSSSDAIPQRYLDLAHEVGYELARRGHSVVTGGGSVSVMGAVARAARAGGATTVGVIPEVLMGYEIADRDAELVVVDTMRERKAEMEHRADAFLTLPGGIGTLEELLEIWTARTLRMHDKPVVVLDPDDAYAPLRAQIAQLIDRGFARASINDALVWATTARSAVDLVEAGLRLVEPPVGTAAPPPPTPEEVLESEP
ncbi:MAG: TIGR00730 family Rossman fold protein [Mycobacteriales bacterium]|nr:TIGR00730 family Rossman fold protein [Frankia sp.]